MEKYFNMMSVFISICGGFIVWALGGFDTMLQVLIFLVITDFITGMIKGIYLKDLSSTVSFKGIFKKILIFVMIAVAVQINKLVITEIPLREIVIMFYVANDFISILENIGVFLPIPKQLKDIFEKLRNESEETTNE